MYEVGEVIAVKEENVTVKVQRRDACGKCGACGMVAGENEMKVEAINACGAVLNDKVAVELKTESFYKAALILYGIPFAGLCIGFLIGLWLGTWAGWGEYGALSGFFGGVICAGLAYVFIRSREAAWRAKNFVPVAAWVVEE